MKVLTKVALRIFAIYFGAKGILAIDQLVYLFGVGIKIDREMVRYNVGNYLFSIVLFGVIGILLWVFSEQISNRIVTENGNNSIQFNVTDKQLEGIIFRLMGFALIVISIEPIMRETTRVFLTDLNRFDILQRSYLFISLLNPAIRVAIGLFLLFKKKSEGPAEDLSI